VTATHFATSEAKRSRMTGGALTEEALDSSRAILAGGMFDKGLEQFFTPPIAAQFIKDVIDLGGRGPVLDPTAGNGALLEPWAPEKRFGIEIDTDHTSVGAYQAIRGDLQQAYPMLKLLGVRFPRISANPPFGLPWRDGAGNAINSTVYTYRISHALLADDGVGAIIGGRDRFRRDVLALPEAAGIVALLDCDDLFADDGVQLPCVIAFFVKDSNRFNEGVQIDRAIARADLADEGLAREIRAAIHGSAGYIPDVNTISDLAVATSFKKVDGEMERRRIDAKVNRQAFDLMLAGGRVSSRPGPFARAALANAGDHRMVERLHRQPVSYFALNLPEWRAVNRYADEGLLTIDPALTAAVSEVTAEAEREIVPLYHVRPQQRLGFLEDLDSILCTVGDPDAGFVAGERYPLSTSTDVLLRKGVEIKPNKKGEPVKRDFEEEAKVLAINIGSRRFTEAKEDVEYILEHFDVPDPGDIATRFPEAVERQRRNLLDIQEQYGRGGFAWKKFQLEDLSRIAAKVEHGGGAMLMWEQGGGKTLGAAGFALAAVQNGAANQVLFIVPQDLIPQYRDDIREKLGIEVEHIDSPRMAREVARKMKDGQDGWYVTHYEVLSLLGAKDERDPQTVFTRVTDNEDGTVTRRALEVDEFCPKCHATLHTGWQQNSPLVCDAKVRDDGKRRWAKRQRGP